MPDDDLLASLRRLGLLGAGEPAGIRPLTGGVSSDIHLVEAPGRRFCVKRALARLKVAAVWEVPLGRNAAEAAWMRTVGAWLPHAVPRILGEDVDLGLFAMEYLEPAGNPVWKTELLAGRCDPAFAAAVGRDLAFIHARGARDATLPARFANDETFEAIRIEPYLVATAVANPDLAGPLRELAARTLATRRTLVHGDVSPKNILCGRDGPVFLDAECAWFGDPAFDLAFCLNHLLLKGARPGADRPLYLEAFAAMVEAYRAGIDWEPPAEVEARAAALLPALLLARIDGKSPIEYLKTDNDRERVRAFARPRVAAPPARLDAIATAWRSA